MTSTKSYDEIVELARQQRAKDYEKALASYWEEAKKERAEFGLDYSDVPYYKDDDFDAVEHPQHYNSSPSGVEAIQICEHESFCIGNAFKYLLRYKHKNGEEDLRKAVWYINREIARVYEGNTRPD